MKTFVIGDIHGAAKALQQCILRSDFDIGLDRLIILGDVVDGWSESKKVVEMLLLIKNRVVILGNHDDWFKSYINTSIHPANWQHGAAATQDSYWVDKYGVTIPPSHEEYFNTALPYYIDSENRCFVHGGFNRHFPIDAQQVKDIFWWDRDLWLQALSSRSRDEESKAKYPFKIKDNFKEVYIGHTPTINWGIDKPIMACNVINMDTGAGYGGRLSIMDVDSKKIWQSDPCKELYTNESGR